MNFFRTLGLKSEIAFFIENLSALLSAGISISEVLSSLKEEMTSGRMRRILGEIEEEIENGSSLSDALGKAKIIPPHTLSLIRLGEQSGRLSENLKVVILQNEKEATFRSEIRSSLMYAVIVFTLTVVLGAGISLITLPKLGSFFEGFDVELPLVTRILIAFGQFLGAYGFIVIPLFLFVIGTAFYFLFSFPKTKFVGHRLLFKTPIVKKLIKQVEIARFGFLFGTMLEAGMPVTVALKALQSTTTFLNYQKFYVHLTEKVQEGNSLKQSFALYPRSKKLFPSSVRQMITAAERAGALPETLLKIGSIFEKKTEATARNLPIILEPILLLIVGAGVALLALGVILPIYSLSGAIQ